MSVRGYLSYYHPQCPFIQMNDTDVTFLSCYNVVGHTRMHVMTLTSPPTLPLSRPWAGLSMRRFMPSHLLIQGSSLMVELADFQCVVAVCLVVVGHVYPRCSRKKRTGEIREKNEDVSVPEQRNDVNTEEMM